ncbi:MAG: hypothetical protein IPP44_10055 [Ideonella sp.]|nr:hypothetical protein [Ideonella sp.]
MKKLKRLDPWPVALALAAAMLAITQAPEASAQTAQTPRAAPWVAGLTPDRRPEAAPTVAASADDADSRQQRLAGIERPWPGQIERVAAEQGRWYSPLFQPGMPGRYDLRSLHGQARP